MAKRVMPCAKFESDVVPHTHSGEHVQHLHGPTGRNEYVDVRGFWPKYICGMQVVELVGKPHSISLADARVVAEAIA